jgi:hypothetical protein
VGLDRTWADPFEEPFAPYESGGISRFTGGRGRIGLDPEHLGHDPLELGLDELGEHHLVCQALP